MRTELRILFFSSIAWMGLSGASVFGAASANPKAPDLEKIRTEIGLVVGDYSTAPGSADDCIGGNVLLRRVEDDVILTVGASSLVFTGLAEPGKNLNEVADDCQFSIRTDRSKGLLTQTTTRDCGGEDEDSVEVATLKLGEKTLDFESIETRKKKGQKPLRKTCRFLLKKAGVR